MRVPYLSNCETEFVRKALEKNITFSIEDAYYILLKETKYASYYQREFQRLDGRTIDDYRTLQLYPGKESGSCLACLGKTKVLSTVTVEIQPPKTHRPNEGSIFVNVELSPMGAPNFEQGRLGDEGVDICRMLERVIKESGCIDTESLCIQQGEKAWELRVNVEVLDEDGSLVDCASAATLTALLLSSRPDITIKGDEITINRKDPVKINLYHHPVAVTFGLYQQGNICLVDPTWREERSLDGSLVYVFNSRKEICAIHTSSIGGSLVLKKEQIMKYASRALQRALDIIAMIREVAKEELKKRAAREPTGFVHSVGLIGKRSKDSRRLLQPLGEDGVDDSGDIKMEPMEHLDAEADETEGIEGLVIPSTSRSAADGGGKGGQKLPSPQVISDGVVHMTGLRGKRKDGGGGVGRNGGGGQSSAHLMNQKSIAADGVEDGEIDDELVNAIIDSGSISTKTAVDGDPHISSSANENQKSNQSASAKKPSSVKKIRGKGSNVKHLLSDIAKDCEMVDVQQGLADELKDIPTAEDNSMINDDNSAAAAPPVNLMAALKKGGKKKGGGKKADGKQ